MLNILTYLGMSLQSEVCLWALLGLVRTIFDATLFKVNANLKQVWQMTMPPELTLPVQRVLRTVISGVMLVQCFTVYVYLASYIVLLYPVFLEERPTLVLPWLLLAAIRKLLCELTSLALGLGTCVMLGASRPPCIRFVILKAISIMPAFYMWMLIYSYYNTLKVAAAYKTFPVTIPAEDNDYGLELAIRRRRTKSLLGEDQLRQLVIPFYTENSLSTSNDGNRQKISFQSLENSEDRPILGGDYDTMVPHHLSAISNRNISDIGCFEDWFGSEVRVPRDSDRILEQFGVMMLRISAFLNKNSADAVSSMPFDSQSFIMQSKRDDIDCATLRSEDTETPTSVGNSKINTASYLHEYPQIFNKKHSEVRPHLRDDDKTNLSIRTDDNMSMYSKSSKTSKMSLSSQNKTRHAKAKKIKETKRSEPIVENSEISLGRNKKVALNNSIHSALSDNGRVLSNTQSFKEDEINSKAGPSSQTSTKSAEKKKPPTTNNLPEDKKEERV